MSTEIAFEPDPTGEETRLPPDPSGGSGTGFTDTDGALSIESDVADGAEAKAFSYKSSNTLRASAYLSVWENAETETVLLYADGGLFLGKNTENWWGEGGNGESLISFRDSALGESANWSFLVGGGVNGTPTESYIYANGDEGTARLDLESTTDGGVHLTSLLKLDSAGNEISLKFKVGSTERMVLSPFGTGAEATPYIFDTEDDHTAGSLFEIWNHGSPKFVFDFQGVMTLTPITKAARNLITPAEGMFCFQSDNTPGPRFYTNGHWQKVSLTTDD